jgi:hypothetical protein
MPKDIFYNNNVLKEGSSTKHSSNSLSNKKRVDINKLLNRVKIDKRKEIKKKFVLLGFGILILGLTGIFVSI